MTAKTPAYITIEELVRPFGWSAGCPALSDVETRSLHLFLQVMHELVSKKTSPVGETQIPKVFWNCVQMPSRLLCAMGFQKLNDAKALAIALCPGCDVLAAWREAVEAGDAVEYPSIVFGVLTSTDLTGRGVATTAGDVYAEGSSEIGELSFWFGRKAGRAPALSDQHTWIAIENLFNIVASEQTPDPEPRPARDVSKVPAPKKATVKPAKSELKTPAVQPASELRMVAIADIVPAADNHRKEFDKTQLKELADSIKAHGVLQPLALRAEGQQFVIIAGERRWRAAQMAGLKEVPAQILNKSGLSESMAMLEENIRRVDLNPIERAEAIRKLMSEHGLTQKEVGNIIGVQQGQVSNELRLLNLPPVLRTLVAEGKVPPTLIRVLLPYCDVESVMHDVAKSMQAVLKDNSIIETRELESWLLNAIRKHSRSMKVVPASQYHPPNAAERYFAKVSPQDLQELAIRKIELMGEWEGNDRAFNLKKFGELNAKPLAARRKKYEESRAKNVNSSPKAAAKKNVPFESEYRVREAIDSSMEPRLIEVIEKCRDKHALRTVCLAMLADSEGNIADALLDRRVSFNERLTHLLKAFSLPPAGQDALLKKSLLHWLKGNCPPNFAAVDVVNIARTLGVDLLRQWTPDEALLQALTDHGRQLVAGTPPGEVPAFLRSFFGLDANPKKGKAA